MEGKKGEYLRPSVEVGRFATLAGKNSNKIRKHEQKGTPSFQSRSSCLHASFWLGNLGHLKADAHLLQQPRHIKWLAQFPLGAEMVPVNCLSNLPLFKSMWVTPVP